MKFTPAPALIVLMVGLVAPSALAETGWLEQVPGSYSGEVSGEDYTDPVITEFILTPEGRILGSYVIAEPSDTEETELVLGLLTDCEAIAVPRLNCTWHDRYGSGSLKMTFADDFSSFEGRWNIASEVESYPWTGQR